MKQIWLRWRYKGEDWRTEVFDSDFSAALFLRTLLEKGVVVSVWKGDANGPT